MEIYDFFVSSILNHQKFAKFERDVMLTFTKYCFEKYNLEGYLLSNNTALDK